MSPESLIKQEYSEKSDAFSFGITLWEMVYRSRPYADLHDLECALKVANDPKFRPLFGSEPEKRFPLGLLQLMKDCWEHKPEKRPTFTEILRRLDSVLAEMS